MPLSNEPSPKSSMTSDTPSFLIALKLSSVSGTSSTSTRSVLRMCIAEQGFKPTGQQALPLLVALGRAVRLPQAGLWAALVLAVSPVAIRYSQEARHYALLLLFGLLATVLLLRALEMTQDLMSDVFHVYTIEYFRP